MRAGSSEELGGSYASGCYGAAMGSLLPACILNRAWVGHSDYGGYYHQPTYSRKKGAWATRPEARACIALARSRDLIHWEHLPPLAVSDRYTLGMELPFLFKHGRKWDMGYSMYSSYFSKAWLAKHPEVRAQGGVHYLISDRMFGPYRVPDDDCLGCQPDPPPYAVQLIDYKAE